MDRHDQSACDPLGRAERIVATSARHSHLCQQAVTTLCAFGPFPVLVAFLWYSTRSLQEQLRHFSHLLHRTLPQPLPMGEVQRLVISIPFTLLAALACALLAAAGAVHLLRHRSRADLAAFWRRIASGKHHDRAAAPPPG